jgi:hypothetical protein
MKKIRKYEIINVAMFFIVSLFVLNAVYAQDARIIQDTTVSEEVEIDSVDEKEDVVLTEEETKENVGAVAEVVEEIRDEAEKTEDEVRANIKTAIDRNIINIRKTNDTPSYELQKTVDAPRIELFDSLSTTLQNINITNSDSLESFYEQVEEKVMNIEKALEDRSGIDVDFDVERRSIKNTLLKLQNTIELKKDIIKNREGDKVYEDTDGDGLSDYDEKFIYDTDPEKESTLEDGKSDSEKIAEGIDPSTGSKINYDDVRQDQSGFVTDAYKLEAVKLIKQEAQDLIRFEGRALPNSFVTLYIYSTPIIVTVKTDANGDWNFELDKELEDGEHQLYVATVSNSGKIIARSNPVAFTKTADAASVGILGIDIETSQSGDFFRENFILISLAILIGVVVLALMLIGRGKTATDVVSELKNEVDNPELK